MKYAVVKVLKKIAIKRYFIQCFLASISLFIAFFLLHPITHAYLLASLGATTVIIFTFPNAKVGKAKCIITSYMIGIIVGSLCFFVKEWLLGYEIYFFEGFFTEFFAAFAVGMTMVLMIAMNAEHPPVAGLSLGLVIHTWSLLMVFSSIFAVVILLTARKLLNRYLVDLI